MTQSQNTADRIDGAQQANQHPDDATTAEIATALEGRQLHDPQLLQKFDAVCARCDEKNDKRRMAGIDPLDPSLTDGDPVTIHAIHTDDDDGLRPPHWHIRGAAHTHHPQIAFDDVVTSGTSLVRARCGLHERDGRFHIVDVTVTDRSRTDAGPDQSVVEQRRQQFVDDSDEHPDNMMVIDRDPEDPPAHWPQLDRGWLDDLVDAHGPLTEQTYQITVDPPQPDEVGFASVDIDLNPWGPDGR